MSHSEHSVVLQIDRTRSIHAAAGSDVVSHCASGTDLWPRYRAAAATENHQALQFCLAADKAEPDPLYEGDLFAMLGVGGWDEIADYDAAARFTRDLVSLEALLLDPASDLEAMLDRYASAIAARKKMASAPADARRWDDVQVAFFRRLRRDCVGEEMPLSLDKIDKAKKANIERFAELYADADGPKEIDQPLFRLRWLFASSAERAGLCGTAECRDGYELKSEQELKALARRPSATIPIFLPESPRKKRLFGAGFGMGANIAPERIPFPQMDLWLAAQYMSLLRVTAAASARPEYDDRTTFIILGNASYGQIRRGLTAAAVGYVSVMPWGEGFSIDGGGGIQCFEGTITDYYSPEGQSQKYLQGERSVTRFSPVTDVGITVFPREWLRMRMNASIPTDASNATFAVTLGLHHWFW